jgi:hypothetical protein
MSPISNGALRAITFRCTHNDLALCAQARTNAWQQCRLATVAFPQLSATVACGPIHTATHTVSRS